MVYLNHSDDPEDQSEGAGFEPDTPERPAFPTALS